MEKYNYIPIRAPYCDFSKKYLVWKRQYSYLTLKYLGLFNNLHIFTAARQEYCDEIINKLFYNAKFNGLYYRHNLDDQKGKNLNIIFGDHYNDKTKLLIDDKIKNHANKNNNFYKIKKYDSENNIDRELLKLCFLLH
jgi:TFIIF-interacting CTD phosphatase-like protein